MAEAAMGLTRPWVSRGSYGSGESAVVSRKVVVIGAGVLGLNTAVELASDPTLDVTVVEAANPGSGSTGLSAGVYTTQYLSEDDVELRVAGVRRLLELERDHNLTLRHIGLLRFARDEETVTAYERSVEFQQAYGVHGSRVIGADEVRQLLPHFRADGIVAALYSPVDGYLDGNELCSVLADEAMARGVQLRSRTSVLGVTRGQRGARYTLVTNSGVLGADVICNCAGAWAETVGEAIEAPVRVVNERHEAYVFEKPETLDTIYPMVLDNVPNGEEEDDGLYFRAEGETQLVAGLHANAIRGYPVDDPDAYQLGITDAGLESVVTLLDRAFPTLEGIRFRNGWAGLYPHSPDGLPIAGPHPANPDVMVGGGLGGVGLSLGGVLGRVIADWVSYGEVRAIRGWERLVPRRPELSGNRGDEQ
jgi:sarcosine oxidase, subunit beta